MRTILASHTALAGICLTTSGAAVITWGPATAISTGVGNSSDVSTNGTVVEAFNAVANYQIGTAAPVTVNTVIFTPTTSLLGADPRNAGANDFSSTTNSGDATYDTLVSTLQYGGGIGNVTNLNDQFSIGTFTADGTSQTLTLASGAPEGTGVNFGQSHINAYQIRLIPEPSVGMLGLLGFAGMTLRRS